MYKMDRRFALSVRCVMESVFLMLWMCWAVETSPPTVVQMICVIALLTLQLRRLCPQLRRFRQQALNWQVFSSQMSSLSFPFSNHETRILLLRAAHVPECILCPTGKVSLIYMYTNCFFFNFYTYLSYWVEWSYRSFKPQESPDLVYLALALTNDKSATLFQNFSIQDR